MPIRHFPAVLLLLLAAGLPAAGWAQRDGFVVEEAREEVVPVLRKEFAVGRPAEVPDAPTHESLLAAKRAAETAAPADNSRVEGLTT